MIMDGSVADGTTVVDGPTSHYLGQERSSWSKGDSSHAKGGPKIITRRNISEFLQTDYLDTDKPFFIVIEKDGLVSALQKLDTQLRNVRMLVVM